MGDEEPLVGLSLAIQPLADLCLAHERSKAVLQHTGTNPSQDVFAAVLLQHDRLDAAQVRSEEHTSELQSRLHLVCRLLLEKKKNKTNRTYPTLTVGVNIYPSAPHCHPVITSSTEFATSRAILNRLSTSRT